LEEDREQIQREKDQLLTEKIGVREAVTRALHSVSGLAHMEEETVESQVGKLAKAIQQLQARVVELELQAVSSTRRKCEIRGKKLPGAQSKESRHWL
jgi:hypothetical protein